MSRLFESLIQRQTKKSASQAKDVIRIWDVANRRVSRCIEAWAESPPSCTWASCIRPLPSVWPRCTGTWSALGWPSPCRASAFYTWIQDGRNLSLQYASKPKQEKDNFVIKFLQWNSYTAYQSSPRCFFVYLKIYLLPITLRKSFSQIDFFYPKCEKMPTT